MIKLSQNRRLIFWMIQHPGRYMTHKMFQDMTGSRNLRSRIAELRNQGWVRLRYRWYVVKKWKNGKLEVVARMKKWGLPRI